MSQFNLATNHPLIPNANEYLNEQKYVSIHSEDRDILKYPNSSEFEIELPQDYLNVQSLSLTSWSFPSNYNVFSDFNTNRKMSFRFTSVYDPNDHAVTNTDLHTAYEFLTADLDHEFIITIEEGFYAPEEMAKELETKFNAAVNYYLLDKGGLFNVYNAFKVIYNSVQQKLWFGNERDQFDVVNDSLIFGKTELLDTRCARKNVLPQFVNWGLPSFLGFTRCSVSSESPPFDMPVIQADANVAPYETLAGIIVVPRIYSSEIIYYSGLAHINYLNPETGMWLLPDSTLTGSSVFFLKTPMKINLMGSAYFYMEINGLNCLDETSPFNVSTFTTTTNQTNGIVNSAFAKLSIPTTPISQWFDDSAPTYKWFNPPAERIRKLKIKLRYHDGKLVEMGGFDYTFMIGFNLLRPQMDRKSTTFTLH